MEVNSITLKNIWDQSYEPVYKMVNEDPGIANIFEFNIQERLIVSNKLWLIMKNDIEVGFVNLVTEKADYNFLFLDMGIKEEYRNQGIGGKVLQKLIDMNIKIPIILETKNTNVSANQGAIKVGVKVMEYEDKNIYLLQKDRLTELLDNGLLEKLGDHYQKPNKKRELVK